MWAMSDEPEQRPEGRLIERAMKSSRLTGRKAAPLAGMSEGRWRQIVSGRQPVTKGVYAPVRAPADTLARMARVVGVTPEQLEEAGRPDAADELRELVAEALAQKAQPAPDAEVLADRIRSDPELAAAIARLIGQATNPPPPPDPRQEDSGETRAS